MVVTLDREQQRTVRAIKRDARRRFPNDPAERRRFVNAGIQTGLVEQALRNRMGGDADSSNWRQEREQGYGDEWARTGGPLNLEASVDRFGDEFEQFADPGERSFEIAAQVQRPAAQYRGRYRERATEANAIRRAVTLRGGRVPPARGAGGRVDATGFEPGVPAGLLAAAAPAPRESLVPGTTLQAPAHSARPVLPEGFVSAAGGGGAPPVRLRERLAGAGGLQEDFSAQEPFVGVRGARREARSKLGLGGMRNAEGLADEISRFARDELGIEPGSRDRSVGENAGVGGSPTSMHLEDRGVGRGREAVDLPTTPSQGGWAQYRRTARKLGLKPAGNGFTEGTIKVGGRRFNVEVIFGERHGHGDHIHVGFARL
jgi:hypothetical protein